MPWVRPLRRVGMDALFRLTSRLAFMQDAVFSAAYSGERHPYSPAKFLWSWWQHAADQLAGHQQQDAHEFYLFMLSRMGQSVAAEPATPTCTSGHPSIHSPGTSAGRCHRTTRFSSYISLRFVSALVVLSSLTGHHDDL